MRFASPGFLPLLALLPLLAWIAAAKRRGQPAVHFSRLEPVAHLGSRAASLWLVARDVLRLAALALLILALSRPQQGLRTDERNILATDILLCLDVSDSMRAEDFAPKNRITVAKDAALRFIEKRSDDRFGLVVFAEAALTQCPLTTDHGALAGLLQSIRIGDVPPRRTAIGDGLAIGIDRLKDTGAKSKVIILLTDGANNAGDVDPVTAAKTGVAYGVKIYAIGAASPEGGYMTMHDPVFGARKVKIADSLDEETLTRIATATGGKYFRATDARGLREVFDEIDELEKTELNVKTFTEYLERFEWFLMPGLGLVAAEAVAGRLLFGGLP